MLKSFSNKPIDNKPVDNKPIIKTILLVEDDPIIAIVQAKKITKFGYNVIEASSGEQAIKIAQEENIDLILMDIDLGKGIDGPTAATEILKNHTLPIVFLTSHTEKKIVEKVRGITAYGYVVKNSGDFVLENDIRLAFQLFNAHESTKIRETHLRSVINAAPVILWEIDKNGIILLSAGEALGKLNLQEDQRIGQSVFDIYKDQPRALEPIRRGLAGEEFRAEVEIGGRFWSNRYVPQRDENGNVSGVIGVSIDITERKQAELASKASETQLRFITDNIPASIAYVDAQNLTYSFVNKTHAEVFGKTTEQIQNLQIRQVLGEEAYARALPYIERACTGKHVSYENQIPKHGKLTWFNISYIPEFDSSGKVKNLIVLALDIEERKRSEETLKNAHDKLDSIMRAIPDLLFEVDLEGIIHKITPHVTPNCSIFLRNILSVNQFRKSCRQMLQILF